MELEMGLAEDSEVELKPGLRDGPVRMYVLDRIAEQRYLEMSRIREMESQKQHQEERAAEERKSRNKGRLVDLALGHIFGALLLSASPLVCRDERDALLVAGAFAYCMVMSAALIVYGNHKYPSPSQGPLLTDPYSGEY